MTGDPVAPLAETPRRASAAQMYFAVVGVGVFCALAIVSVYEATRPVIRDNRIRFRNEAILDVLPNAISSVPFRWTQAGRFEKTAADDSGPDLVFAGYDADQQLVGVAIEANGTGYQDVIRVLYGYAVDQQAIVGIRVLESRETPGLGDRVETDSNFLKNFEALDVRLNTAGDAVANPLEFVKPGAKRAAWQIDGISGATITSQAIAAMLRDSTATWAPRVYSRRSDLKANIQQD